MENRREKPSAENGLAIIIAATDCVPASATVVASGFFGAHRRTVVRAESGETITVQHSTSEQFAAEQRVTLRFVGDPIAVEAR